jgi:hypothetical protein
MYGVCALQALCRVPGLRRLHKLRRMRGVLQLLGLALCRRAPRRARLIPRRPHQHAAVGRPRSTWHTALRVSAPRTGAGPYRDSDENTPGHWDGGVSALLDLVMVVMAVAVAVVFRLGRLLYNRRLCGVRLQPP